MFDRVNQTLRVVGVKVAAALPTFLRDLAGVAAVGLIAYGAWLITPAAGFIVGGTLLLTGVILLSRKG